MRSRGALAVAATAVPAIAFLVVVAVDALEDGIGDPAAQPLFVALTVAVCAAVAVTGRWPRAGHFAALFLLSIATVVTSADTTLPVLVTLIAVVAGVARGHFAVEAALSSWWLVLASYPRTAQERAEPVFVRDLVVWLLLLSLAWVLGAVLAQQDRARNRLRDRYEAYVHAQRVSIASSLHDTIAQSNTAIVLTAESLLSRVECPGVGGCDHGVRQELETIIRCARDNANDLQSLMTSLRFEQDTVRDPLDEVGESVAEYLEGRRDLLRAQGLQVRVLCEPTVERLAPAARRVVLRVCREATANMLKHAAAGPCTVQVATTDDAVEVVASNPVSEGRSASGPGGLGLVGLRESVTAIGGSLEAGCAAPGSGTWVLVARLPVRGGRA